MPKRPLRELPREQLRGPWPLLQVSQEDRRYKPTPESPAARKLRVSLSSLDLLALDLGSASLKGAFLGLFVFAVTYSFVSLRTSGFYWLVGWHWVFAIGALLLLLVFVGFDITLLIVGATALWLSFREAIAHPFIVLLFLAGGVIARWIIELFPVKQ